MIEQIPRIKLLSTDVASKIAAGEVVERPSSVLKELLENSIDAKATNIRIEVLQGGIQAIKIIDNGCGILKEDLELSLQQHATSKINDEHDLVQITSLGFRGEALASINSVAKLSITSQTATQEHAWKISHNNISPAAHPIGSSVLVEDLFYNVPARRKFLKSPRTEYIYLEEVFRRIALCNFNIAFSLYHNDKLVKNLGLCKNQVGIIKRMEQLCGKQLVQNAKFIDCEQNGLRLWGFVGDVTNARSQEPHQYFFINKRIIKDRLINHALRQVYQPLCLDGKMPFYCLHLELDPIALDVNVHPTKHEVRFRDPRIIHAFITSVLTDTFQSSAVFRNPLEYVQEFNNLHINHSSNPQNLVNAIPQVLCILENMLIAIKDEALYLFDANFLRKKLLLDSLMKREACKLEVPIPLPIATNNITQDFVAWCLEYDLAIEILTAQSIVIRSMPSCMTKLKMDFVDLIQRLQTAWRNKISEVEVWKIFATIPIYESITMADAKRLIEYCVNLNDHSLYRKLNADELQMLMKRDKSHKRANALVD